MLVGASTASAQGDALPETFTVDARSDSDQFTDTVLLADKSYTVVATGTSSVWSDESGVVDALYCFESERCEDRGTIPVRFPKLQFNDLGLDEFAGLGEGGVTYQADHRYEVEFTGVSGKLKLTYSDENYADNSGSYQVTIDEAKCESPNRKTGTGYSGLSKKMKAALGRLYGELDAVGACYRFSSGYRSQAKQNRLYKRWHKIADKKRGDKRSDTKICRQLKKAGFAQCPKGHKPPNKEGLKVAKGGPAKRSRHSSKQAADITVRFPTKRNLTKYRKAARSAGLCGPAAGDPVHVELPYKRKDGAHKKKLFKCHFPEGPAPPGSSP